MEFTDQIEEVLDGLEDPTADELVLATSMFTKHDVLAVLTRRALATERGEISGPGSVENPVDEAVVNIVGSASQPIPLFITGPPVGSEDDYLAAVVTGDPDYSLVFLISRTGAVVASPTDTAEPVLSLASVGSGSSVLVQASGSAGEVLVLTADGGLTVYEPGVRTLLTLTPDQPSVPATPVVQDVVDALVALSLITQEG